MSTMSDTAPEALAPPAQPRTKWTVLAVAGAVVVAVALWALIAPEQSSTVLGVVVGWTSQWFGWFYIALATVILIFVLYLGVRHSRVRLGQEDDRPEFSTFAWASMLFAAGIGTDVMFYAVAEPASQYLYPPQGEGGTLEAAREATVWTLFHYGITGWGMYALMGIALGYYAHRLGLPLAVRSTLYPLIGKRVKGPIGDAVDIATVIGTIFGVATSLGIGVVMLNVGLDVLFGVDQGIPAQIGLVVLAILVATISATTGVDKGIRLLSQLNVLLAIGLAGWVLVTGETAFLLRGMMMNVGDFVSMFPGMTMDTMAFDHPADWMSAWTLFFWAWWIAWASFVGMFLARISKGRTIGQFVLGTMTIPFSYIVMWVSIFGNSAVEQIRSGDAAFGEAAVNTPELGFFTLLQEYPLGLAVVALATFVGLLFYVTSADSGALVMANLSSELPSGEDDARPWLRILWSVATGVLTIAMLLVGGIPALQSATIIMGLPFAFVIVAVMIGLHRALESERTREGALQSSLTTSLIGREESGVPWRLRLARTFGTVSVQQAQERMSTVVVPALESVREALAEQGVEAEVVLSDVAPDARVVQTATLQVPGSGDQVGFSYPVQIRRSPAPAFGTRSLDAHDRTTRLQVAQPIVGGYDLMGYDAEDVCHDVLDHYERWAASSVMVAEERQQ
ncbi:High-affinity choline uptake protein BetT [Serinicoccus hydrothermalis]|uniref:High-affinity choline uptake protein BetT n=1 Tax=Serinicoccus hydrothermalis TaxID=1758689 RepID=A0A1B1N9R4_9MICO|nr:choline BCCT transporter BetT [Serinicoccus hydrothermalis]ANS78158.1 High-affinity choline uptake protein BetT [Serinicoccus hydrothermalis]